MKNMKRALRRYQTKIHQQRRLKEDINQHAHDNGGIPHYLDSCPIEEYPEWSYKGKDWTEPTSEDRLYIGYPKLNICGDGYSIRPLCPCLYSIKFHYRFKSQPQDKLSSRMKGDRIWNGPTLQELKFKEFCEYYDKWGTD